MEQGEKEESLRIASEIQDVSEKSEAYSNISKILMEQGEKEESLRIASEIQNVYWKSESYSNISKILKEQGDIKEAKSTLQESFELLQSLLKVLYVWHCLKTSESK